MRAKNGWRGAHFSPKSASSFQCLNDGSTFSILNLNLACKQLCFLPKSAKNKEEK